MSLRNPLHELRVTLCFNLCVGLLTFAVLTLPIGRAPEASETESSPPIEASLDHVATESGIPALASGEAARCQALEPEADETEEGPVCHGILTCTFYVAGHVIALPFRLLRGALDIII